MADPSDVRRSAGGSARAVSGRHARQVQVVPPAEAARRTLLTLTDEEVTSGIYGTIVGAAALVAADGLGSVWAVLASVLGTVLTYWVAESYAASLARATRGMTEGGGWHAFRQRWRMLLAPSGSLVVFLAASWLGASIDDAVDWALVAVTLELLALTYLAAARAGLPAGRRGLAALVGLALGLAVIGLKTLLH